MPARIPRLYRKHTGVYWVRVLVPKDDTEAVMPQPRASGLATHADTLRPSMKETPLGIEYIDPSTHDHFSKKSEKRKSEIRRSLRTKNPSEAATMASKLNAALSDAPRSDWGKIMQEFLSNSPERPEKTSGESRESALIQMMREFPELRQALAENIKNNGLAALGMGAAMRGLPTVAQPVAEASLAAAVVTPAQQPARPASVSTSHYGGAVDLPARPTRLQDAIAEYKKRLAASELKVRTVKSQVRSIDSFSEWLELAKPSMGKNPYVHQILAPEINAYISHHAQNRGGRGNHSKAAHIPLDGRIPFDDNKSEPKIKASTRKKRLLEISKFFNFAHRQLKACKENPVADLEDVMRDLASKARAQLESYMPFSDQDLKALFDPVQYMLLTRDADYFWAPLLSAHLGLRLGEIVLPGLDDIRQDAHGLWHLNISAEVAKNQNSQRRVPITQPLIDLGFLEYVEHVRRQGATRLWPHRRFDTNTGRANPTKNQSLHFGHLLTKVGIRNERLVFHSFRHTVVTALLDAGTPVHISMQICGHEAQQMAIERQLISPDAIRSSHLQHYTHADTSRLGKSSPLEPLKQALEHSVKLPIDYRRLRSAAEVIREHTRREKGEWVSGWAPQRQDQYIDSLVSRVTGDSGRRHAR